MKKFIKFVFSTAFVAAAGFGAYKLYEKYCGKGAADEEEIEDDLEDFEIDEEEAKPVE